MKAPPRPVVLTAGVKQGKNWKPKGRGGKGKKKKHQIQDDEEASNSGKQPSDESTPASDNGIATAQQSNGLANGGVDTGATPSLPPMEAIATTTTTTDETAEMDRRRLLMIKKASVKLDDLYSAPPVILDEEELMLETEKKSKTTETLWLAFCFFGIMGSFVCYGLLLEYATSGGKHLHELSFLFVTSLLYTTTARVGRYARAEKPSTIPPAQFAVLGLTSMGSTFFSVRALRYVIFPIQVLAKSCKPVPVMLMGALMGKKYPAKKYLKVVLIVGGVCLFMLGG
jgi:hypothetical protein